MTCPKKPYILKPGTVFVSLVGSEGRYDNIVELLKETVEDWGRKLQRVQLDNAQLGGIDLSGANLKEANLSMADLKGALLIGADLQGASLLSADLVKAWICRTDLRDANLSSADLSGAYILETELKGAILKGTDLRGADLSDADLHRVRGLTTEMLLKVFTLYGVKGLAPKIEAELRAKKPRLFEKPDFWMVQKEWDLLFKAQEALKR
ncbi:MAG: pentapeptide repeat-containing protein [Candidatus Aminicenantes bacterium]|nr:pentapeptide repeat-containing protein [Candidatus Aminicenantes bacterium]